MASFLYKHASLRGADIVAKDEKMNDKEIARGRMYSKGSEECLHHAESLIDDARMLMDRRSFGTVQSLSVTALEEVGKAIILELANLNYAKKDIVNIAMYKHPPKKVVLVGIEQSKLLLGEDLVNQASEFIIDKTRLEKLEKHPNIREGIEHFEGKRQKGFYVDVDPEDGSIRNSPTRISPESAQSLVNRAEVFLELGKALCKIFRDVKKRKATLSTFAIMRVKFPEYMWTGEIHLGDQPDYDIAIYWDEA